MFIDMRPLHEIAREIRADWGKPYFGASPYIKAMFYVTDLDARFGYDDGRAVVRYFLANAGTWRGETARRIKKELNDMLK
jgi:hypothetical protein